jgi:predicted N-acetyltransferase YhbS
LDGGLVLKSIADLNDAERLATYNGQIFGQGVAEMTRSFLLHHPATSPHHWLYIEDEASGQIVSSICLIPWVWRYEDVTLKSGEMGIVSTLESYRNRGLIRALDRRFKELLREEECDLSHIQGIPYFYRQFGYEYAMPLEAQWQIELRHILDRSDEKCYSFRRATVQDIPVLMRLYDETTASLNISTLRSADIWQYMLEHTTGTDVEGETWLMLDTDNQPTGYFRLTLHGFGTGLIVSETSRLSIGSAKALLTWLKATALEQDKPYVRLNLPVTNDLLKVARGFGARDSGGYEWQMHIPDVAGLLRKLSPVLERRIAGSLFAGLSKKVILNLYREAFEMDFERGKLVSVNAIGFCDGGEIRLPPNLLAPLVLGYHTHQELRQMYPDVAIWGEARLLVDVLFPKMESFIYTNY